MTDIFVQPKNVRSVSELMTKTQDGQDLYIGAGWVLFGLKGAKEWNRRHLVFDVGPQWSQIRKGDIVPSVALASIMNVGAANNAGWAIDDCTIEFTQPPDLLSRRCRLNCDIAVRDTDGIMYRVTYHIAMLGTLRK